MIASIHLSRADLNNPDSSTRFAAGELRYYLGRMTAENPQILPAEDVPDDAPGFRLGAASGMDVSSLGPDGFRIESRKTDDVVFIILHPRHPVDDELVVFLRSQADLL